MQEKEFFQPRFVMHNALDRRIKEMICAINRKNVCFLSFFHPSLFSWYVYAWIAFS